MLAKATKRDLARPITLEQFCRALAAHAMITAHPNELHKFTAPEITETVAQIIFQFASGEDIARPTPADGYE